METSLQILVIILSTTLAVLLVLSIVIAVQVLRVIKAVSRITDKAEHIIQSAEHVGQAFSNATGSMAIFKVVRNVVDIVSKRTSHKK